MVCSELGLCWARFSERTAPPRARQGTYHIPEPFPAAACFDVELDAGDEEGKRVCDVATARETEDSLQKLDGILEGALWDLGVCLDRAS